MGRWLTPDTLPSDFTRGALFIPDDPAYLEAVYGALLLLATAENWELFGSVTPDQAAALFFETLSDFIDRRGHALDIGDVFYSAQSSAPAGCLACTGGQVSQADYPQLYALLGTAFGPAAGGNFTLPDLRGRTARVVNGSFPLGDSGGNDSLTLSVGQLPSHHHSVDGSITFGATIGPDPVSVVNPLIPASTGDTGSGDTIDIKNPYLTFYAYIVAR